MAAINETAYPTFKLSISEKELSEYYTPNHEELVFAKNITTKLQTRLCLLIMLKCFQNLGYFVVFTKIPKVIIQYISAVTGIFISDEQIEEYVRSTTKDRHVSEIRNYLKIKPFDSSAIRLIVDAIGKAAKTKDEPLDLVNLAIEELIRNYYELPAFNTLEKAAKRIRTTINRSFYKNIVDSLTLEIRNKYDTLIENEAERQYTFWNKLKQDPASPTVHHLKELVRHLSWLKELNTSIKIIETIPYVKIKQFALEAKTLDASKMKEMEPFKRYALISCLIYIQAANTVDDLAEMLIKRMMLIHKKGKEALEKYRKDHLKITDELVLTLKNIVTAYQKDGTIEEKFSAIDSVLLTWIRQVKPTNSVKPVKTIKK